MVEATNLSSASCVWDVHVGFVLTCSDIMTCGKCRMLEQVKRYRSPADPQHLEALARRYPDCILVALDKSAVQELLDLFPHVPVISHLR